MRKIEVEGNEERRSRHEVGGIDVVHRRSPVDLTGS